MAFLGWTQVCFCQAVRRTRGHRGGDIRMGTEVSGVLTVCEHLLIPIWKTSSITSTSYIPLIMFLSVILGAWHNWWLLWCLLNESPGISTQKLCQSECLIDQRCWGLLSSCCWRIRKWGREGWRRHRRKRARRKRGRTRVVLCPSKAVVSKASLFLDCSYCAMTENSPSFLLVMHGFSLNWWAVRKQKAYATDCIWGKYWDKWSRSGKEYAKI